MSYLHSVAVLLTAAAIKYVYLRVVPVDTEVI